jgi:serine/threonine protein kinase/dipeptidyl aminopeptidase/acylaminoacyl peptidase
MHLTPGTRLGPYEIAGLLGKGGMGEVYRAHDPRLNRDVAIKTSREEFNDRFQREARAIAALNHPNICHLYDVAPNYLVMELVEGDTLMGPLPLDEALAIARQIGDALEAAHEKGIIHRDLKPANIKVTREGVVKVLDFGLARLAHPEDTDPSNSPTTIGSPTRVGTILGTASYMAPEQARGKTVDKRADIWAFGVVLYEILTGKKLFGGDTISDVLAGVLKESPDLNAVPAKVRRLIACCLEKDPKKRLRDIGDAWRLLEEERPVAATAPARRSMLPWALAAAGLAAAGVVAAVHFRETRSTAPLVRFTIPPPEKSHFAPVLYSTPAGAISPDGTRLAFPVSGPDGKRSIWLRTFDSTSPRPIPGTDNAIVGCWSPDNKSLAFYAGGKIKRIEIASGLVQTLADSPNSGRCDWSPEGVILLPGLFITRVSASGGPASQATQAKVKNTSLLPGETKPAFLPDGKHFLFETGNPEVDVWVASLDAPDKAEHLMTAVSQVLYSEGYLLFLSGNTLVARPFDAGSLTFRGEAVPVAEHVRNNVNRITHTAAFDVSPNGWLVYQQGFGPEYLSLTLLDRNGKRTGTIGEPTDLFDAVYSPDRKSIAAVVTDASSGGSTSDIWVYDAQRGLRTRFTFGPAIHNSPVWSPDGRSMAFFSYEKLGMYRRPTDGSRNEELLAPNSSPRSFSPDGRFLAYNGRDAKGGNHIWILPDPLGKVGSSRPFPFLSTPANEESARFSPDGKWVAYQSDESGKNEVYVASFPNPATKRQVSNGGGTRPHWNPNGKELFFLTPDQKMMAAEITLGAVPQPGVVRALFGGFTAANYDVSADGQHFLTVLEPEGKTEEPVTVVQNWVMGLKK